MINLRSNRSVIISHCNPNNSMRFFYNTLSEIREYSNPNDFIREILINNSKENFKKGVH